jgi:hypothetical protein
MDGFACPLYNSGIGVTHLQSAQALVVYYREYAKLFGIGLLLSAAIIGAFGALFWAVAG